MVAEAGFLGASFFCSRDYLNRKELKNIFPTLAYQLACRFPAFRNQIIRLIKRDPSVAQNALISQFKDLIIDPLSSTNISCVIIVDALDECVDDQPASAILSVLGRHVRHLPSVKFFITGRPEPRIRTGFRLPLLEPITQIFLLHEVESSNVDEDIRLYLQAKLTAVAKRRSDLDVSDPWPCDQDLTTLTEKSSGLFIFASTLARFIESEHHGPHERLQLIVMPSDSTVHEGRAGIDPLYTQVLEHAFLGIKETTVFTDLRKVLGTVILAFNPLSREQIAKILGVNARLITTTLRHLHSVLLIPNEDSKEIRVFHKSFPDLLQNRDRCSNTKFLIDPPAHHGDIALGCLGLLKKLKRNACDLPDFVMNRDVPNIPELLEDKVGSAIRYACGHWAMHVRSSPTTGDYTLRLITSATEFFRESGIQWIEVMSLENRLESVVHSIHTLFDWFHLVGASTSDLRHLAEDYLRFTKNFFHLIQQSAPHIYHSALPLSPTSSTFHSIILRDKTLITEIYGRPKAWGTVVQTIQNGSHGFRCLATFDHRIAVAHPDGALRIYDAISGALKVTLGLTDPVKVARGSPDGSILFCAHRRSSITSWDIQTGGLIHTFTLAEEVSEIAVSSGGRYLAYLFSSGLVKVWEVANGVEEVANEVEGAATRDSSPITYFCWLEQEEHLLTIREGFAYVQDVVAGTMQHSFVVPGHIRDMIYSQELDRLATISVHGTIVTIIDLQTDELSTLPGVSGTLSSFAFSQTTEEIVCATYDGLRAFNFSTKRWRDINHPWTAEFISSLPNGTLVVAATGFGIQLLNMDDRYAPPSQSTLALDVSTLDQDRIIAFRPPDRSNIRLLDTSTMSNLLTISTSTRRDFDESLPPTLSASLENRMVVYCFEKGGNAYLQLYGFGHRHPKFTAKTNNWPLDCGISPAGTRLVTLHTAIEHTTRICVWDAGNGQLQAEFLVDCSPYKAASIAFDSETRFYSHHDNYRVPYDIGSSPRAGITLPIIRHERQPWTVESNKRRYTVDSDREWVLSGSERICWVPPGYFRSNGTGYCWAEPNTLLMIGEDKVLRSLTFRSQESCL